MDKILSIIIPTYNMEKYLRVCLDSLLISDTKMPLLEVVIVNDGSKDNSSSIAHEYERKYQGIFRVIDKENGNYGSCINRGLKEVTGQYVKVLDADDWFDKTALEEVIDYLSCQSLDLLLTLRRDICEGKGECRKDTPFKYPEKEVLPFSCIMDENRFKNFQMHWVTYRTEIFKDICYSQTEGISYTDNEWIFAPITRVQFFSYIPVYLYNYLVGRPGQTVDPIVQARSNDQLVQVVTNLIHHYELLRTTVDDDHHLFLKSNLLRLIGVLYARVLLNSKDGIDRLIEFDNEINDVPNLYLLSNEIKYPYGLPLISSFRRNSYSLPFYFKFLYKLCGHISAIKSFLLR